MVSDHQAVSGGVHREKLKPTSFDHRNGHMTNLVAQGLSNGTWNLPHYLASGYMTSGGRRKNYKAHNDCCA